MSQQPRDYSPNSKYCRTVRSLRLSKDDTPKSGTCSGSNSGTHWDCSSGLMFCSGTAGWLISAQGNMKVRDAQPLLVGCLILVPTLKDQTTDYRMH